VFVAVIGIFCSLVLAGILVEFSSTLGKTLQDKFAGPGPQSAHDGEEESSSQESDPSILIDNANNTRSGHPFVSRRAQSF
jgi:hypothetical protein